MLVGLSCPALTVDLRRSRMSRMDGLVLSPPGCVTNLRGKRDTVVALCDEGSWSSNTK